MEKRPPLHIFHSNVDRGCFLPVENRMISRSETSKIMQLYCLYLSFVYEFVCCYLLHYCDDVTVRLEIMAENKIHFSRVGKIGKGVY